MALEHVHPNGLVNGRKRSSAWVSLAWLHSHTYLKYDIIVFRHIPTFVPEDFQVQLYGFLYVSQGVFYRFAPANSSLATPGLRPRILLLQPDGLPLSTA